MTVIKTLVDEIAERPERRRAHDSLLAAQSELGNLSQSYRLFEGGEHGSSSYHLENMEHACAEAVLALAEFCARHELDLDGAIEHLWGKRKMKAWAEKPEGPSPKVENQ